VEEKTLLLVALTGALAGIIGLGLLPELPRDEHHGYVLWSNDTHAWLAHGPKTWVELEEPLNSRVGACVWVLARKNGDSLLSALPSQTAREENRPCP
jgi:hypothetical protein